MIMITAYGDADTKRQRAGHAPKRRARTRWKKARNEPGTRVAAHAASTSMPRERVRSLLGDPSMVSRSWPRLPDARIEAEIADKLRRAVEALGSADCPYDRQCDHAA